MFGYSLQTVCLLRLYILKATGVPSHNQPLTALKPSVVCYSLQTVCLQGSLKKRQVSLDYNKPLLSYYCTMYFRLIYYNYFYALPSLVRYSLQTVCF